MGAQASGRVLEKVALSYLRVSTHESQPGRGSGHGGRGLQSEHRVKAHRSKEGGSLEELCVFLWISPVIQWEDTH